MRSLCQRLVDHPWFDRTIIGLILFNALLLGLETIPALAEGYGAWLDWANWLIIAAFVLEAAVKITAVAPRWRRYFGDGWNVFDFTVVLLSLVPSTGETAMIARLARLLRVMRLISAIPELRVIVTTLLRSLPQIGHIFLLMGIVFYIYAVAGYQLFHAHDPEHWGNLPIALLTLFRVVTLEDWTDVMYTAMELHPAMWIYFVSFVVLGTFVIINLFIAVVLNNLEQAKAERLEEMTVPPSRDELLRELRVTQQALARLQKQIGDNGSNSEDRPWS